jgi:hypothetical protein
VHPAWIAIAGALVLAVRRLARRPVAMVLAVGSVVDRLERGGAGLSGLLAGVVALWLTLRISGVA